LPFANAEMMNLHLVEISANGAHAVLAIDCAGWHQTGDTLRVPDNITLLHLPPYNPELNPVEKRLGLSARQQAQQQCVRHLRCHRRNLLRRLALAHRSTRPHNLNR
jgi:transposase